jgi:hypothetical protein
MAKKEQKQLILWAVVALVLGVLIGVLMTNAVTTGKAKSAVSEGQYLPGEILTGEINGSSYLTLEQYFDNVSGYTDKKYLFQKFEYAYTNGPANFWKQSYISYLGSSKKSFVTSSTNIPLTLENDYSNYGTLIAHIPFTLNNLSLSASTSGTFKFENGRKVYKHDEDSFNENENPFAEVLNFDFDCSGQYQMSHTDVGDISAVRFSLLIHNPNSDYDYWYFHWDQTPQRTYNYMGYFPPEATAILSDGLDYVVELEAGILTESGNETSASTDKMVNCQTGKSISLTTEQLEKLKEKAGKTQEIIEKNWVEDHKKE